MKKIVLTFFLLAMMIPVHPGSSSLPESNIHSVVINHIISYESFRAKAYWDVNRYSIGYGTRSYYGETITKEEALYRLYHEFGKNISYIKNNYNLSRHNTYVLAAFMYNVGSWGPKMEKSLQRGDIAQIKKNLLLYTKAGGRELPGLVKRRIKESKMLK